MIPTLISERIETLRKDGSAVAIEIVAETGSTNADLLTRIDSLQGPLLLIAETQTAGRGRAGRSWHSQQGASLTFSLAWRFNLPLHGLAALPLAVGVAICEALAACGVEVRLKWPNDVLKDGGKLAGVLIETAQREGATWAVIGIGINFALPSALAERIDAPAAALQEGSTPPDRHLVMAMLTDSLAGALALFEQQGFAAFAARWNSLHAFAGREVVILDRGKLLHEGTALGVDDSGRLELQSPDGRIAIMAGDVSLRPADAART